MNSSDPPRSACLAPWKLSLVIVGLTVVLCLYLLPGFACWAVVDVNTFFPRHGMTMDEIRVEYPAPSKTRTNADGTETWLYYTDRFGLGFTLVGVQFDKAGRVDNSYNH